MLELEGGEARAEEERGASEEKELGGHAEAVLIQWGRQSFIFSRKWPSPAPEIKLEVEFLWVGEGIQDLTFGLKGCA
jgi:hypothetical protein